MATFPDGIYSISLPYNGGSITDMGEGRYMNLLPEGERGADANKVRFKYDSSRKAYTFQFTKSGKFITYSDGPMYNNNKLVTGDKPQYFTISKHEYQEDMYIIGVPEAKEYTVAPALERIYPPWVALVNFPEHQGWSFNKIEKAML